MKKIPKEEKPKVKPSPIGKCWLDLRGRNLKAKRALLGALHITEFDFRWDNGASPIYLSPQEIEKIEAISLSGEGNLVISVGSAEEFKNQGLTEKDVIDAVYLLKEEHDKKKVKEGKVFDHMAYKAKDISSINSGLGQYEEKGYELVSVVPIADSAEEYKYILFFKKRLK